MFLTSNVQRLLNHFRAPHVVESLIFSVIVLFIISVLYVKHYQSSIMFLFGHIIKKGQTIIFFVNLLTYLCSWCNDCKICYKIIKRCKLMDKIVPKKTV